MKQLQYKFTKAHTHQLILLFVTTVIYWYYFPEIFTKANSVLAGITGDALKNYYTYAFHAVRDTDPLNFSGMQFPYGEHIVYTDCQPLLSGILRNLPFSHPYVIGILHVLLISSYLISPLILYKIFKKLAIADMPSLLLSLAVTLLAPQFQKIQGGHHGLAYGFMIPLSLLLCLNIIEQPTIKRFWYLLSYTFLCFFLHPYMGFSLSLLSGLFLLCYFIFSERRSLLTIISALCALLIPIVAFKSFMILTDSHSERTIEPFGGKTILETIDSLLAPDFGPFQNFLEHVFPNKIQHLEGHAYLGVSVIILFIAALGLLLFRRKKTELDLKTASMLLSAVVLLFLSFGWHTLLLDRLGIKSESLNQFRAASRFAWSYYYALPIFLVVFIKNNLFLSRIRNERVLFIGAGLMLLLNLVEANAYFTKDRENFWKYRNVLNSALLDPEEIKIITDITLKKCQAIVPLPVFHVGSETYSRSGADLSMIPAFLFSYHTGIPILGAAMSRTSIKETVGTLDLLNGYHNTHPAESFLNGRPFVVIKTKDLLLADEDRLLRAFQASHKTEATDIGFMSQGELLMPKFLKQVYDLNKDTAKRNVIFIPEAKRQPFQEANVTDLHVVHTQDSILPDGDYIVSYQLNTSALKEGQTPGLIIASRDQQGYRWEQQWNGRMVSGFYKGFQIFEYKIHLRAHAIYEFILQGEHPGKYSLQNFLLRPDTIDTRFQSGPIIYWNNFPLNLP